MLKCILWGTGYAFKEHINYIKYYEQCNHIEVIGVTSSTNAFHKIMGYNFFPKSELSNIDYDLIIVMAYEKACIEIVEEAIKIGISEDKIISYDILSRPDCNLQKYLEIKKTPPSIFSNNCWGGLTYHSLHLKFCSPLINMFESDQDYIKLVQNPKHYMQQSLILKEYRKNEILGIDFPVCLCDDIVLCFNHYKDFEVANECWERRKRRINWNNLFVMMYTESYEIAKEFSKLPYEKKICFVPFEAQDDSLCYLEFCNKGSVKEIPLWKVVNSMATGALLYYDDVELIHSGKIKKMCE